jgi:hypothetical protein
VTRQAAAAEPPVEIHLRPGPALKAARFGLRA